MTAILKVSKRGSLMVGQPRRIIESGTFITADDVTKFGWSSAEVERLVTARFLVRLSEQRDPEEYVAPPGTSENALPSDDSRVEMMPNLSRSQSDVDALLKERSNRKPQVAVSTDTGPWNLDPTTLVGKDVNELNVMISERSPTPRAAFDTEEEAIAWLSQNYESTSRVATN